MGSLVVWEKLACKDGPDWPDGSEVPDWEGWGRGWVGGLTVAGYGSGAPPLDLEMRREEAAFTNLIGVAGGTE